MKFNTQIQLAIFSISLMTFASLSEAKDNSDTLPKDIENQIIDKVVQAYGGDTLQLAKSISISEHNKNFSPGQGESPKQPGVFDISEELTIDFEAKRKSVLSWRVSRTSKDLEKIIFDGEKGTVYDILNNKYADDDWFNYASTGARIVRRSDTMIARKLAEQSTVTDYQGDVNYLGALHHKLDAKIDENAKYSLLINKVSGLIAKMSRTHPSVGEISYTFSNHSKSGGVTYSQDLLFTVGGQVRAVSINRAIEINAPISEAFTVPANYANWGELVDSSKLNINKVSSNVYHVGKGRSYTLFVDTGKYFIAVGGHQGLTENFNAIKALKKINKPLKYVISTHHHNEHFSLLQEAVSLGAKIITVKQHQAAIESGFSEGAPRNAFSLVNEYASYGEGAVEIYDIATMHADNYLLVYLPNEQLIFAEDHFETQLKTATPRVHKDMVVFKDAVTALKLDVKLLLDGHTSRHLSMEEFDAATNAFEDKVCPKGFKICGNG